MILRHFRDEKIGQLEYEFPETLSALFSKPEECEQAQDELYGLGLIALGPALPKHIPVSNRVRAAAVTLEGVRFIERGELDR